MNKKLLALLFIGCLLPAQVSVDDAAYGRIKAEEMQHSQAMQTLHMLTDRYGPRLTGSPNFEQAASWVVKQMTEWGFRNAHLESWDFGHPGWLNMRAAGYIVAPIHGDLTFRVLSWTPSTAGTLTGSAVEVEAPHGRPPLPQPKTRADAVALGRSSSSPPRPNLTLPWSLCGQR
jgi:hypothetical protein